MALATAADLAAYVQQDEKAIDETQAAFHLDAASAVVAGYLGCSATYDAAAVEELDPWDACYVILPGGPFGALVKAEVWDGRARPEGAWLDVTDRVSYSRTSGIIELLPSLGAAGWFHPPGQPGTWRVTYERGWKETPRAVAAVVAQLAGAGFASTAGVTQERLGDWSATYDSGSALNASQIAALAPFRCTGVR